MPSYAKTSINLSASDFCNVEAQGQKSSYQSFKILYCVVLLNGIERKRYVISFKYFAFEKRIELF